jgi:hypothetical protein
MMSSRTALPPFEVMCSADSLQPYSFGLKSFLIGNELPNCVCLLLQDVPARQLQLGEEDTLLELESFEEQQAVRQAL